MKNRLILLFLLIQAFVGHSQTISEQIDQVLTQREIDLYDFDDIYSQCNDTLEIKKTYNTIQKKLETQDQRTLNSISFAKILSRRGHHAQASEVMTQIYGTAINGSSLIVGEYYGALGSISYNSEAPEQAKKYLLKSVSYLKKTDPSQALQAKYVNLGMVCNALKKYDDALAYFKEAEKLEDYAVPKYRLYLVLNRAITWSETGQEEAAKKEFRSALKLFEEHPDPYAEIRTLGNIGDILYKQDSLEAARYHFTVALSRSENEDFDMGLVSYHERLSKTAERLGDFKSAYQHLMLYNKYRGEMQLSETRSTISQLEIQHDADQQKAARIAQKRILKAESDKNTLLWSTTLLFLSLTLLLGILFMSIRKKNRILLERNMAETKARSSKPAANANPDAVEEIIRKLEEYVIDQGHYRQSQLTLEKLAKKLQTNRTYLSEAINAHYTMNFSKWINEVRIQQSRVLLLSTKHAHYSIEGIAALAGFSSVSTFNSNFKSITGLTPSYFRKHGKLT